MVQNDSNGAHTRSRQSSVFEAPSYEISFGSDHVLKWDPPQGSRELAIALSYHFPVEIDLESKMKAATKRFLRAEAKKDFVERSRTQSQDQEPKKVDEQSRKTAHGSDLPTFIPASMETFNHVAGYQLQNLSPRTSSSRVVQEFASCAISSQGPSENEFELHTTHSKDNSKPTDVPQMKVVTWTPNLEQVKKRKKRRYGNSERAKVAANRGKACEEHQRRKIKVRLEISHILSSAPC